MLVTMFHNIIIGSQGTSIGWRSVSCYRI